MTWPKSLKFTLSFKNNENPSKSPEKSISHFFQTQKITFNKGAEKSDNSILTIMQNFNFEMTHGRVFQHTHNI